MRFLIAIILSAYCISIGKQAGLVVEDKKVWKKEWPWHENVNLDVCWLQPGDSVLIVDSLEGDILGRHAVGYLKTEVEKAVKSTWEKFSGVTFNFKDKYGSECEVVIHIAEFHVSKASLGKPTSGLKAAAYLNLTSLRYISGEFDANLTNSFRRRARSLWETARKKKEANGTLVAWLKQKARIIAVHEFGHILGIDHEHNRPEAKKNGEKWKADTTTSKPIAYYDPYSVMNYNHFHLDSNYNFRDRDEQVYPESPSLSCGDVITARFLYDPPDSKETFVPCCTIERYGSLLGIKDAVPKWADFYSMNRSCLESGEIKSGSLNTQTCVALAKQGTQSDVCKSSGSGVSPVGDTIQCWAQHCKLINGESPIFDNQVSLFWKNEMPYMKSVIRIRNLDDIQGKKLEITNVSFHAADETGWGNPPPGWSFYGGFDRAMGLDSVVIQSPLGRGSYNSEKGCFCEYMGMYVMPRSGIFAKYDPEKGAFLIERTFTKIRLNYRIKDGLRLVTYTNTMRNFEAYPPNIGNLNSSVEASIISGDEFALDYYSRGPNKPPYKPVITSLSTSDNGSGLVSVSWSPVSDPDGDRVYYLVFLEHENRIWKFGNAMSNTTIQFSGLPRNSKYSVVVSAFDTKDWTNSDYGYVTTPNLPDACYEGGTSRLNLHSSFNQLMLKDLPLSAYQRVPQTASNTNIWNYPTSFCVEHNPGGFEFADIPIQFNLEPNDWIYIEAEDLMYANLIYGPENIAGNRITPGLDASNQWSFGSGNLIHLADWWGKNSWPLNKPLQKIRLSYKVPPASRSTHRFGRILFFKEGPFSLNFKGIRIGNSGYSNTAIDHMVYLGEPIELNMEVWPKQVTYEGDLLTKFYQDGVIKRKFTVKTSPPVGVSTYNFTIKNSAYPFENFPVSIRIDVKPKPILVGLRQKNGSMAKVMRPRWVYGLEFSGLEKDIQDIAVMVNDQPAELTPKRGLYWFQSPLKLKAKNKISVQIDGTTLADILVKKAQISNIFLTNSIP